MEKHSETGDTVPFHKISRKLAEVTVFYAVNLLETLRNNLRETLLREQPD